jgi:hypothetical protein
MSCIAKLIDIIFLIRNHDSLFTSNLQFAFKATLGTTVCSLVVKETINYYMQNGANVAACLLDATKAFDRLRHDKLFELLLKRKVSAVDLRALMNLYSRQKTHTTWKNKHSDYFNSTNGIRQGAIASPILYCVYMDELLVRLKTRGHGCWLGRHFAGAVCYADDLTLLCPSIHGLQKMVQCCEDYAHEFGLLYNSTKSVCVMFSRNPSADHLPEIKLGDSTLKWISHAKHLGNILSHDLSEGREIMAKKGDFVGRINTVMANLPNAPDEILLPLFKSQCCHYYGCQAWDFTHNKVQYSTRCGTGAYGDFWDYPCRHIGNTYHIWQKCQIQNRNRSSVSLDC